MVLPMWVRGRRWAGERTLLEVFIFDFDRDIYAENIEVEFLHKLRDEERYDSLELLKEQIEQDVIMAKEYLQGFMDTIIK